MFWIVLFVNSWALNDLNLQESDIWFYPWTFVAVKQFVFGVDGIFVLLGATFFHFVGIYQTKSLIHSNIYKTVRNHDEELVQEDDREEVLEQALTRLHDMIGLEEIKEEIINLIKQLEGQRRVAEVRNIKNTKPNLHMVFMGPPGTGKTEVARIMKDILYGLGYLRVNVIKEVDRSAIIGKYVGHTEEKMIEHIADALGGVLFIDEAYALAKEGNDFGQEAIDVLMKAMEDCREDLVVILAGYQAEMNELLDMNEGFRSRIPYTFKFRDYTPDELAKLAETMLTREGYDCSRVKDELINVITDKHKKKEIIGNGRWVRNLVEKIIKEHNIRAGEEDDEETIGVILVTDLHRAAGLHRSNYDQTNEHLKREALSQLNGLVGLDDLKREILNFLDFVEVEKQREAMGYTSEKLNMHMVFTGPPGTGKTTVARIMGSFLNGIGVLSTGAFVEADRSSIVGRFVGHTEKNMIKLIERAQGGILFIDEAYSLVKDGNDFGQEAINVLIKEMEDKREDFIVILAGYEEEMQELLSSNAGLESRISFKFHFPAYSPEEIFEIVTNQLKANHYEWDEEADMELWNGIMERDSFNGNARWARDFVGKIRMQQSKRLKNTGTNDLTSITKSDIMQALLIMR